MDERPFTKSATTMHLIGIAILGFRIPCQSQSVHAAPPVILWIEEVTVYLGDIQ